MAVGKMLLLWASLPWFVCFSLLSSSEADAQRLLLEREVAEIRRFKDGSSFGEIRDVVPTGTSGFALFDSERRVLTLLDVDGRWVGRPAFLETLDVHAAEPVALTYNPEGFFNLIDARTGTATSFAHNDPSGWRKVSERNLGLLRISAACTVRARIFVMGTEGDYGASAVVHTFGRDQKQTSFGVPFGDPSVLGDDVYGFGHLLCMNTERLVIVASSLYPELRAYSEKGQLRWNRSFDGFRTIRMDHPNPQTVRYGYSADSLWDQVISVFSPAAGLVAVQIERRHGMSGSHVTLKTWLISARDGRVVGSQDDIPFVYAATAARLVVGEPRVKDVVRFTTYTVSYRE